MNKYDSELVAGILQEAGYVPASEIENSDIILFNTCSVRESAEQRVRGRLNATKSLKYKNEKLVIGVLGCMSERIGEEIFESHPFVDFVLGPDTYRSLPDILHEIFYEKGDARNTAIESAVDETYDDIMPSRVLGSSAWIAIMRGCNNFCSYCIVPYVRGRERSRSVENIVNEARQLVRDGFIEVTLLGQNVNSYRDGSNDFADIISKVANISGMRRVRFATSHPKDLTQKLIDTIALHDTICNHVHLPVQAGSNRILKLMNRGYTREHYLDLITRLRRAIPDVTLTTDIIVGFPGETEDDFLETKSLVEEVQYDAAFLFKYSPRPGTKASKFKEFLSDEEKVARLEKLLHIQKEMTLRKNKSLVGKVEEILIEGPSKKSTEQYMGRTEDNKIVIIPRADIKINEIVQVRISGAEGHTLFGELLQDTKISVA